MSAAWCFDLAGPLRYRARAAETERKAISHQSAKTAAEEAAAKRLVELGAVRSEWGGACEENLRHSERAVKEYSLTEHASKIESAMGTANRLKPTARLGRGLGEHAFAIGGAPQFGMTKEEAIEQIGALNRDRDFIKRYLSGEQEDTVKMKTLHAAAHRKTSRPPVP